MSLWLPLIVAVAVAQEPVEGSLSEAEAREIVGLFYGITGRLNPDEAFLADDIAALQETGRSAEELERATRWIAKNVEGADRYTLGGILESHLAEALGEEELLILPDPLPEDDGARVLAETAPVERFTPSASLVRELLETYYRGTGRAPPSPPLESDLLGMELLVREGWTEDGLRLLSRWVPDNVRGAEALAFGDIARVAVERGYNGGPRPNGQLETLEGVKQWPQDQADPVVARDPDRFDGGRVAGVVTMGALPVASDRALQAARLPGMDLRIIETTGRLSGSDLNSGGAVTVGQASEKGGFVAQVEGLSHAPGQRRADRFALDGGRANFIDGGDPVMAGRFSIGGGPKLPAGGTVYGYNGASTAAAGAQASILWGGLLLTEAGAGLVRREVDGREVVGTTVVGEMAPTFAIGEATLAVRLRGTVASGGLSEDAFPVEADLWTDTSGWAQLNLRREAQRWAWGVALGIERSAWSLDWQENDRQSVKTFGDSGAATEAELALGGQLSVMPTLTLHGGLRGALRDESAEGFSANGELGLGLSWLVADRAWVSLGARAGEEGSAHGAVSFPF